MSDSMPPPKRQLVMIQWLDPYRQSDEGWKDLEAVLNNHGILPMWTVGWVIKEDDTAITVMPHLHEGEFQSGGDGDVCIPKCTIKEMIEVKPPRRRKTPKPGSNGKAGSNGRAKPPQDEGATKP